MESLLKTVINNGTTYRLQSLAIIANALADLDVQNKTVFEMIKNVVMKEYEKSNTDEVSKEVKRTKVKPIDCAQLMTAFCRVKMFDAELLDVLEHLFISRIDEAFGQTLTTMFISHAAWASEMIDQCLIQKAHPRKVYNFFKQYNEIFYEKLALNLI